MVGNEKMGDEEVIDNIMTAYDAVVHHLPNGENNVRSIMIKLTMGKSFQVGKQEAAEEKHAAKKPKEKEESVKAAEDNQ